MHVFWHNDGVSIRPDNEQEHRALVLLFENLSIGWPTELTSATQPVMSADAVGVRISDFPMTAERIRG